MIIQPKVEVPFYASHCPPRKWETEVLIIFWRDKSIRKIESRTISGIDEKIGDITLIRVVSIL